MTELVIDTIITLLKKENEYLRNRLLEQDKKIKELLVEEMSINADDITMDAELVNVSSTMIREGMARGEDVSQYLM